MKTIKDLKNRSVKMTRNIRIFLYLVIFTGTGMLLNSCMGGYGYVTSEPNYDMNYSRPERPAEGYIWIDGDWLWDNSSRNYVHSRGYWTRPRQNRTYEAGRWESRPEGKVWIRGRWTKENERSANRNNQGNVRNRNERSANRNNQDNERNRNERSSPSDRDRNNDNK